MSKPDQRPFFAPTELWRVLIVAVILAAGLITRFFDLTDPPLDYAVDRQLRSAMIARAIYYESLDSVPAWQLDVARGMRGQHGLIEPEIIEHLTAATYSIVGGEFVWIARIYSSLFWVLGGLALYSLVSGMVSEDGGLIALIYYLFAPFGLVASRTFQPDPLMTAMIITAWMAFYHWYRTASWKWTLLSGLAAGAALYIKSTSIFFLFLGMAIVVLTRKRLLDTLKDMQVWVISLLAGIPILAYYIYGLFITGQLEGQFSGRFFPEMWKDVDFYIQWMKAISTVSGHFIVLLIGVAGLFMMKKKRDLYFLLGIWVGYIIYGMAFSYHISTHKYYTLPMIPLLSITLGVVADRLIGWFRQKRLSFLVWAGTVLVVLVGMGGGYYLLTLEDYRHEPPYYQKVADFVGPENKIVALSQNYAYRLSYFGWRVAIPWQGPENLAFSELKNSEIDSFAERFSRYRENFDYFIITNNKEFRRQEDLYNELFDHYPVHAEGGGYIIFNLKERFD